MPKAVTILKPDSVCRSTLAAGIFLLFALLIPVTSEADGDAPLTQQDLVELLRQGGYSLYFRHEATDWSQSDSILNHGDWLSCDASQVRQLSAAGREAAKATGAAIRALGIPVAELLASPYCRCMETAALMQLGTVEASEAVINMRIASYFGGRDAVVETARALLARRPPDGSNRVIVAHGNVAINATSVYPDEGEGLIFKADAAGGFEFVGRLSPEDWQRLVAPIE